MALSFVTTLIMATALAMIIGKMTPMTMAGFVFLFALVSDDAGDWPYRPKRNSNHVNGLNLLCEEADDGAPPLPPRPPKSLILLVMRESLARRGLSLHRKQFNQFK